MKTKRAEADAAERKRLVQELNATAGSVSVDWIRAGALGDLQTTLDLAIARLNMRILVLAYAAAIVKHGSNGGIDWESTNAKIAARFRLPGSVDLVKLRAWKVIYAARNRQKRPQDRVASLPKVKTRAERLKPVLGLAGRFAAWIVAIALLSAGAGFTWKALVWAWAAVGPGK